MANPKESHSEAIIEAPANRNFVWWARGIFAILIACFILIWILPDNSISVENRRDEIVYKNTSFKMPLMTALLGLGATGIGALYWNSTGLPYSRILALGLFLLGGSILIHIPGNMRHEIVITPTGFRRTIGNWYSPESQQVDFQSVNQAQLLRESNSSDQSIREIIWSRDGKANIISTPVYDLLQSALPEVLKRAEEQGVSIIEIDISETP